MRMGTALPEGVKLSGSKRYQRIRLGIVGRATPVRKRVTHHSKLANGALDAIGRQGDEIDTVARRQSAARHFPLIEKYHIALAVDAATTIGHRVERGGIVDAARKNCPSKGVFPD